MSKNWSLGNVKTDLDFPDGLLENLNTLKDPSERFPHRIEQYLLT